MGNYVASNNAASTLVGAITASATSLSVQVADASKFPTVNNGGAGADYSMLTLQDSANNIEIVKVTRHDSGSSSFTVVRGQEGTTARAWNTGDAVACRLTAGVVTDSFVSAQAAASSAAAAAASASSAVTAANGATTTANSASAAASSAQTAASSAQTAASNAQTTANSAVTKADSALGGSANDSTARAASASLVTANFSVLQIGAKLVIKYGGTTVFSIDSSGNLISAADVSAFTTP